MWERLASHRPRCTWEGSPWGGGRLSRSWGEEEWSPQEVLSCKDRQQLAQVQRRNSSELHSFRHRAWFLLYQLWWLDKGLSRVFKVQTGFEFWGLRFRNYRLHRWLIERRKHMACSYFDPVGGGGGGGTAIHGLYRYMCRCEGNGFQAVYSRIGYKNHSVWV